MTILVPKYIDKIKSLQIKCQTIFDIIQLVPFVVASNFEIEYMSYRSFYRRSQVIMGSLFCYCCASEHSESNEDEGNDRQPLIDGPKPYYSPLNDAQVALCVDGCNDTKEMHQIPIQGKKQKLIQQ